MSMDGVDFDGGDLLADELVEDINAEEVIEGADLTEEDLLDPNILLDDGEVTLESNPTQTIDSPMSSPVVSNTSGSEALNVAPASPTPVVTNENGLGASLQKPASPSGFSVPVTDDSALRKYKQEHQGFLSQRAATSQAAQAKRREDGARALAEALQKRADSIAQTKKLHRQEQEMAAQANLDNPWKNVGNLTTFNKSDHAPRMKKILLEKMNDEN